MSIRATNSALLQAVASAYASGDLSVHKSLRLALEALMHDVHCTRISLWRFEVDNGERGLRCFVHQFAGQAPTEDSTLLAPAQYREYFAALVRSGMFVSYDTMSDDRLLAMRGTYLQVHGITALLDLPVSINGRAYGIVCCEQTSDPHVWTKQEIVAARETVTRAALLVASQASIELSSLDSIPIEPF